MLQLLIQIHINFFLMEMPFSSSLPPLQLLALKILIFKKKIHTALSSYDIACFHCMVRWGKWVSRKDKMSQ